MEHHETAGGPTPEYARLERMWDRIAPFPKEQQPECLPIPPEILKAQQERQAAGGEGKPTYKPVGAVKDPCCMGTEATGLVNVVEGFAQEEIVDGATFARIARYAPSKSAAAALRDLGRRAEQRGRELAAAYYLITGEVRHISSAGVLLPRLPYRELLREMYHNTACTALNYARAAEGTADLCLSRLFDRFSAEAYRDAEEILKLLAGLG